VQPSREELLSREKRWSLPVALATLTAIGLLVVATIVVGSVNGDDDGEVLLSAHEHSSAITSSSLLQALAFTLLVAPLVYLFRAAGGRSTQMRGQLIGLIVAAPLFLAVASVLNGVATNDASSEFVAGKATADLTVKKAKDECRTQREDVGAASFREEFGGKGDAEALIQDCVETKISDDEAENAINDAEARDAATGFSLGGRLGLAFALVYCCLYGLRTGLLTRFWGSLGMALGVAALLLLVQFTLIWFLYFALLVAGWVPKRPPAWAAGVAIPWPTPGEKASAELEGDAGLPEHAESEGEEEPSSEGKRKRKQRD
jgi:hypothetical protein